MSEAMNSRPTIVQRPELPDRTAEGATGFGADWELNWVMGSLGALPHEDCRRFRMIGAAGGAWEANRLPATLPLVTPRGGTICGPDREGAGLTCQRATP